MHLSRATEQSIFIMVLLYTQDRKIYLSSKEISERLDMSLTYLKKIMRKLVVNDLVKANPGVGGGYRYKSNKKVTLYDIYKAINGEIEVFVSDVNYVENIFEGAVGVNPRYNKYLKKVNEINLSLKKSLSSISIEDILSDLLEDNANIKLDWNRWEEEFEILNSTIAPKKYKKN